jgi:hypothetical protein
MSKSTNLFKNLKNTSEKIDEINDDSVTDDGFSEGIPQGNALKSFSFDSTYDSEIKKASEGAKETNNAPAETKPVIKQNTEQQPAEEAAPKTAKKAQKQKGATPPIDGEPFTIKRSYHMRESTIRLLMELKAAHPDVNVYLNTIMDAAVHHYHDYIFKQGGKQK